MAQLLRVLLVLSLMVPCATVYGAWENITTGLLQGKSPDWPGGCAGVAVNRLNGDVYVKVCGLGIYRSSDEGQTYSRVDNNTVSGRNETAFAWDQDQANPARQATFSLDGTAGGTLDGTTWKSFASIGRNWDFASVDWISATPSVMMATLHESGGQVHLSTNGGTSWSLMNVNIVASGGVDGASTTSMVGVLDANTLIYCKGGGIYRSTDRGSTWSQVSTQNVLTRTPRVLNGKVYLGNASGLLVSTDNGATWSKQGGTVTINQGPYFGADENTMVVVNTTGISKTENAGDTWTRLPATIPSGGGFPFDPRWFGHYAYDPVHNNLYASAMGSPAYKWDLGPSSTAVPRRRESLSDKGISVVHSTVRSSVELSRIDAYSLSGRLVYRQHLPSGAYAAALPRSLTRRVLVYKVSTVDGDVTEILR